MKGKGPSHDILSVHPGPLVSDILTLQSEHRSAHVWDDPKVCPLSIHRSSADFWKAFPLDVRVQAILLQVGFYGVYMAGSMQLDHSLITSLVERWRQETHTFHLPVGEATVTLQDVGVLWGLPVDGNPVIGTDPSYNPVEWQAICLDLLGYMPSPEHFDGDRLKLKSISAHLEHHPLTPNTTEDDVLRHARCRILQIIGSVMGDKSGTKVKLMYLLLLRDIDEASRFSWGSAALASLYRALCRGSHRTTNGICGPLGLLQLWAWERIPKFRPQRHIRDTLVEIFPNMPIGPRGCMWNTSLSFGDVGSHVLRLYRDQLDSLMEGEFIWQPYSAEQLQKLPDYCLRGQDTWCVSAPLINFDVVEYHLPRRVMRQFGYQQHVPDTIDTDLKLHRIDRRGRKGTNWTHTHAQHIEQWERRRDYIVQGLPAISPMDFFSEYMIWYRQITRLLIGNPEHRPARGFRPVSSVVEFWGQCLGKVYELANESEKKKKNAELDDLKSTIANIRDITAHALTLVGEARRMPTQQHSNFDYHDQDQPSSSRRCNFDHADEMLSD